jgi:membrane protein insertase Oxa1/YidC/SpoIIIJ
MVLPVLCLFSTYMNLELGFAKLPESQRLLRMLKDNLQLLLIMGAPLTATLPSGVFVYWLTSTLFSHAQFFLLKGTAARDALGFPPTLPPPAPPAPNAAPTNHGENAGAGSSPSPGVGAGGPRRGAGAVMVDPALTAPALAIIDEAARRAKEREAARGGARPARPKPGQRSASAGTRGKPPVMS